MDLALLEKVFPLAVTLLLAASIPLAFMGLSALLGPKRPDAVKLSPYECGIQNRSTEGDARGRFDLKFYLTAMCFLVFDVEVAFLYPWAIWFGGPSPAASGYIVMAAFVGVLALGWLYLVRRGALEWD